MRFGRRAFVGGMLVGGAVACVPVTPDSANRFALRLRIIEAGPNGVLAASFFDTGTGQTVSYNGYARFPHCSSFKLSLAGLVLGVGLSFVVVQGIGSLLFDRGGFDLPIVGAAFVALVASALLDRGRQRPFAGLSR